MPTTTAQLKHRWSVSHNYLAGITLGLAVAMTMQRWRLSMVGRGQPAPLPGLTLRVRGGLPMQVTPR